MDYFRGRGKFSASAARFGLGLLMMATMALAPVRAQAPPPAGPAHQQATAAAIAQLNSPFCPGRALANCPSPDASALRADIGRRIDAGESIDAVVESVIATYGEGTRGVPRMEGAGAVAWTAPGVVWALTFVALVLVLRHVAVRRRRPLEDDGPVETPEIAARLDDELQSIDAV